jgi:sugar/nucleoside kinase (ribokinase family)
MHKDYDVMIAGHLCLDIIPQFKENGLTRIDEILRPGKLVNVCEAIVSTGGPVSNTGINMKTLGNKVCFCARVGDDEFGKMTVNILKKNGNADGVHIAENSTSSYTIVIAPKGIDRIFLHNPATNDIFSYDDINIDLLDRCKHFHFGYPSLMEKMFINEGVELKNIFKTVKSHGLTTSCDMSLPDPYSPSGQAPWRKILENILPDIDFFLPSVEEIFYMLYPDEFLKMKQSHNNVELLDYLTPQDYSRFADELLMMGCKMVALKTGHRGFYVKTTDEAGFKSITGLAHINIDNWANRELWAPAYEVDSFGSATGSGDSSIAGLLSAYIRGEKIERALKYATCCGLQNVRVMDAISGIKSWEETTGMIQENMPLIDAHIIGDSWKWLEAHMMWEKIDKEENI